MHQLHIRSFDLDETPWSLCLSPREGVEQIPRRGNSLDVTNFRKVWGSEGQGYKNNNGNSSLDKFPFTVYNQGC